MCTSPLSTLLQGHFYLLYHNNRTVLTWNSKFGSSGPWRGLFPLPSNYGPADVSIETKKKNYCHRGS